MNGTIAGITFRQLLGRRRVLLLLVLGAVLVLVALAYRLAGGGDDDLRWTAGLLENFGIATLMPLVALVLGTGAIGAEIEDGTIVYILAKPISRSVIVATKLAVAALAAAALTCGPILLAGIIAAGGMGNGLVLGFTLAAAIGSLLYAALFVALSLVTGRALVFGLFYVLLWEGFLSGLFAGTRTFSIRQHTLAFAEAIGHPPTDAFDASLDLVPAVVIGGALLVISVVVAIRRLRAFELRGEAA
ncbi:MAG: ABC transporter permease subunit [Chloroflexota bacterium]